MRSKEISDLVLKSVYFNDLKNKVLNEIRENNIEVKEFEGYKKVIIGVKIDGELHNKIYYEKKDQKIYFFVFKSNTLFNESLKKNNIDEKSLQFKELEYGIKEKELNSEDLKKEIVKMLENFE